MKNLMTFSKACVAIAMTFFMAFGTIAEAKAQTIADATMTSISPGVLTATNIAVTWNPRFDFEQFAIPANQQMYLIVFSSNRTAVETFDPARTRTDGDAAVLTGANNINNSWQITGTDIFFTLARQNQVASADGKTWNSNVEPDTPYHVVVFAYNNSAAIFAWNVRPHANAVFSQPSNIVTVATLPPPSPPELVSITPDPDTELIPMEAYNTITFQFDMDVHYFVVTDAITMVGITGEYDEYDNPIYETIDVSWTMNWAERADRSIIEITYLQDLTPGREYRVSVIDGFIRNLELQQIGQQQWTMDAFYHIFTADEPLPPSIDTVDMSPISVVSATQTAISVTWLPENPFIFDVFRDERVGTQNLDSAFLLVWSSDATKLETFDPTNFILSDWTCSGSNLNRFCHQNGVYFRTIRAALVTETNPNLFTNSGLTEYTEYHLKAFAFLHNRAVFGNTPPNLGDATGVYFFSQASNVVTQRTLAPPPAPVLLSVTPNPATDLLPIEAGNSIVFQFDMDVFFGANDVAITMIGSTGELDEEGDPIYDTIAISWPNTHNRTDLSVIEITYNQELTHGRAYRISWIDQWVQNDVARLAGITVAMDGFYHIFTAVDSDPLTGNSILTFYVNDIPATINEEARTIVAQLSYETDLTDIEVLFTISEGAVATVLDNAIEETHTMDFTNPVIYVVTSEAGEQRAYTVTITRQESSSIRHHESANFEIYPNPAIDVLNVTANNIRTIEVINMMGVSVIRTSGSGNSYALDVSNLSPGLHFIRITTDTGISVGRFVKQ